MKKLLPLFVLAFCALIGCCMQSTVRHPSTRSSLVDDLKSVTVALVYKDNDGDYATWCTGVWVDVDKIVTADHCARAPIEDVIKSLSSSKESSAEIDRQVQMIEDGFQIRYMVSTDSRGVWQKPKKIYKATVLRHDKEHDLALLQVTGDRPQHRVANLASYVPSIGDNVHVMGHPAGMTWTYTKGLISAYREERFRVTNKRGPFIQIAGEVWKGNSGGGGFNDEGELIGIASFISPAPGESFFIHFETIRSFLGRDAKRH